MSNSVTGIYRKFEDIPVGHWFSIDQYATLHIKDTTNQSHEFGESKGVSVFHSRSTVVIDWGILTPKQVDYDNQVPRNWIVDPA